jgi:hypothetical protein
MYDGNCGGGWKDYRLEITSTSTVGDLLVPHTAKRGCTTLLVAHAILGQEN